MTIASGEISARLRSVTEELRSLERDLGSEQQPDALLVQDFRDALDSSRMTAWTITELMHARAVNPELVVSFLFAERIRRFAQMAKDLSADIDDLNTQFHPDGISALSRALELLQSQLTRLARK